MPCIIVKQQYTRTALKKKKKKKTETILICQTNKVAMTD